MLYSLQEGGHGCTWRISHVEVSYSIPKAISTIGNGSRGARGARAPPEQVCWGGTGGHWSLVNFRLAYESCCEIWCISSFSVRYAWITIRFFTATTEKILQTSITVVEGGCGFTKIGRCLKIFVHNACTIMLSAPLTASIFLPRPMSTSWFWNWGRKKLIYKPRESPIFLLVCCRTSSISGQLAL